MCHTRSRPSTMHHVHNAAPSAFPASDASGWMNRRSKPDFSSSNAFMTEFKATPPERHRRGDPVSSQMACPTCSPIVSRRSCTA